MFFLPKRQKSGVARVSKIKRIPFTSGPHLAAIDYRFMRQAPAGVNNRHKESPPPRASAIRGYGAVKRKKQPSLAPSLWVLKFNHRQFTPLVKKGDRIEPGQVIGLQHRKVKTFLNLARRLKVDPAKVRSFLLPGPGTVVEKGEILARRRSLLGAKLTVVSPQEGQFKLLKRSGWAVISRLQKKKILALLSGEVTAVYDDKLTIRFMAQLFSGKTSYRRQQWAKLISTSEESIFGLQKPGKPVFLLLSQPTSSLVAKAKALGVKAIISPQQFPNCPLPNFAVADYNALLALVGRPALLDGKQQRLLVCREEKS